jgi:CheY-like chemotaxis protein
MSRILLVDDEPRILGLFRDLLAFEGFDVVTSLGGSDAVKLACERMPDLILMDIMMPGKDGGQIAEEILTNPATQGIPIVFLTNIVTEAEIVSQGGKISGRVFISKSTRKAELIKKINEILSSKNTR